MKNLPFILTPGPTVVSEEVLREMGRPATNPDIDPEFYEFYKSVCEKLKRFMKTKNDVVILCGEGILGLEAACASLTEKGDRVLIIDNGIFGAGFKDFVEMYGGETVMFTSDYEREISPAALEVFLEKNHDFKYATVVHCETPSGITNPIDKICPLLKKYGIMTVVDSVSGMGGEELRTDEWGIDIALGGSQKCLSAPVGLTFLSVSPDVWKAIEERKTPIASFYANLAGFKTWYEDKWFPYTMPVHLINALDKALDRILERESIDRHTFIAGLVRKSILRGGLELYPKSGFSSTVTAVKIPEGVRFSLLQKFILKKHNILIAGSFGYLKNKIIRIGHMGEGCSIENMYIYLLALDEALANQGFDTKEALHKTFTEAYNEKYRN